MEVMYEQCPWNEEHVRQIYRNLASELIDGEWRNFPTLPRDVGAYRVFANRTFQAIYSRKKHSLFQELLCLEPPDSEDDAEWDLLKERGVYHVSSSFAKTFRTMLPVDNTAAILRENSMDIVDMGTFMRGEAFFRTLTTDNLGLAMRKLTFVENLCMAANIRAYTASDKYWDELGGTLPGTLGSFARDIEAGRKLKGEPKRREPLPAHVENGVAWLGHSAPPLPPKDQKP